MPLQNNKDGRTKQLRDAGERKPTEETKMGTGIKPGNNVHNSMRHRRPGRDCDSTLLHLRVMRATPCRSI